MKDKKALCLAALAAIVLTACAFPTLARPTQEATFTRVPTQTPTQVSTPQPSPTPLPTLTATPTVSFAIFGGQMIYYLPGVTGIKLDNGKLSSPDRFVQVTAGINPAVADYFGSLSECQGYQDWGVFEFIVPQGAGDKLTLADYNGYMTFTQHGVIYSKTLPKAIFFLVALIDRTDRTPIGAVNSVTYVDRGSGQVIDSVAPDLKEVFLDTAIASLKFKGHSYSQFVLRKCESYFSFAVGTSLWSHP